MCIQAPWVPHTGGWSNSPVPETPPKVGHKNFLAVWPINIVVT